LNRRSFIKYASLAAAGNAAALRPFGALNALAQGASSYKALVCVFLFGGNDANNTLIQFDTAGTTTTRRSAAAGDSQSQLLQLSALPNFALNPNLPDIQTLFDNKNAAFVANVGTLMSRRRRRSSRRGQICRRTCFPIPTSNWNGRTRPRAGHLDGLGGADRGYVECELQPWRFRADDHFGRGDTLFCNGSASTPVSVSPGNLSGAQCSEGTTECNAQKATAQALLSFDSGLTLVQADNSITSNAYNYAQTLTAATQSVTPLMTVFPANNALAAQLKQIAQIIQVRAALGVTRQIFFCGIGNFDTHADQLALQNALLASISRHWRRSTRRRWRWECRTA